MEDDTKWMVVRVHADGTRVDHEQHDTEDDAHEWAEVYNENLRLEPFMVYEVERRPVVPRETEVMQ